MLGISILKKGFFDEVRCPREGSTQHWMLADLYEELALVIYHKNRSAFSIHMFDEKDKICREMSVFGVGEIIDGISYGSMVAVLGYSWSGELVVEDFDGHISKLFLYNLENDNAEELPWSNAGEKSDAIFLYTESLISVNAGDEVTETDSNYPEN